MGLFNLTPDQAVALTLFGAGGLQGGIGQAGLLATQYLTEAPMRRKREGLLDMQIENYKSEIEGRKAKTAREQAEIERQERIRAGLPTLFGGGGLLGGEATPQTFSGTDVPMFSAPSGVAPMRQAPAGGFDLQRALALGMTPDEAIKAASLQNLGRPKVAREVEVMENNRPVKKFFDEFGQPVGSPLEQWKAPVFQNLGDRTVALDPVSLSARAQFAQGMSPEGRDASARGWAGLNETRRHNAVTEGAGSWQYDANRGVLVNKQTGEAKPATMNGQPVSNQPGPMTEAQGKANLFGSRMVESHRILSEMENPETGELKYSPMGVASRIGSQDVPLIGGPTAMLTNMAMSKETQMAEQAQRDFVNAVLRRESGAVISKEEFANARQQYFPQPGDSPAVIAQKRRNREAAIRGIQAEVPGGFRGVQGRPTAAGGVDNDPLGLRR